MADVQPKKFRFSFNVRGVENVEIKNAPVGWEKTTVTFKRHSTYRGILKSLTLPFSFVFKGAGILRNEFYRYGLLASVRFLIEKNNPSSFQYKSIYKGVFDFTQFEDSVNSVAITSINDDLSLKIAANEAIKYRVPLNVPGAIDVFLTSIKLKEKADLIFLPEGSVSNAFFPLQVVNNDQHSLEASVQDVDLGIDVNPDFSTSDKWFYRASTNTTLSLKGYLKGRVRNSPGNPEHYAIKLYNQNGTEIVKIYDYAIPEGQPIGLFDIQINLSIDVSVGDRLFWYFEHVGDPVTSYGFTVDEGELNLSYKVETPGSLCKALRGDYVFNELIQLMNDKGTGGIYAPYPTMSNLLSGLLKQMVFTCSNSIRQIPVDTQYNPGDDLAPGNTYRVVNGSILYGVTFYAPGDEFTATDEFLTFSTANDGSVLLVSFNPFLLLNFQDFFQTVYSIMGGNASFGLDGGLARFEDLSYVYRQSLQILDVGGSHSDFTLVPATDLLFNSIKAGYVTQQYDTLNGTQAVNATQFYSAPAGFPKKELNLISPTGADALAIEQIRTTPVDSAASRSDNDNWLIWIKEAPEAGQTYFQPLRGEGLISISGVDAGDTYYNWMLTPKRNLLRGGPYLASIFYGLQGSKIRFESAEKNFNFTTVGLDGKRVNEKSDIEISNLPSPVFMPHIVKFSTNLPDDALSFIEGRSYGAVYLNFRGYQVKGFIDEISTDQGQNSTREYTLLLTADNNLLNLIQ